MVRVVESKATLGLPLAVAPTQSRREGAYGTARVRARGSDPSKKCSARTSSDAGDEEERTGSCAAIGVASVQGRPGGRTGEGKAAFKVDGGSIADGFLNLGNKR